MKIKVTVFKESVLWGSWSPEEFLTYAKSLVEKIPVEFRETAEIETDSGQEYERYSEDKRMYCDIVVSYWREETKAEVAIRNQEIKKKEEDRKALELKELDRLQKKYLTKKA